MVEALQNAQSLDKILLSKTAKGDEVNLVKRLALEQQVPVQYVPVEKIDYLLFHMSQHEKMVHQGVLAFTSALSYTRLEDLYYQLLDIGETPFFLILDGITDVRNIGAIARSALCFNAHAIIIPSKGMGQLGLDAIKSSAGALQQIPVCKVEFLSQAIQFLKLCGVKIYAAKEHKKTTAQTLDFTAPCAIVMGAEERGVSGDIVKMSDGFVSIPMSPSFDSLNVSVATGILLCEVFKQRNVQ